MASELFLLIVDDRHTGVDAWAYSTLENAHAAIEEWVESAARHPEDVEWDDEPHGETVRHVVYSCEDDSARIVRRVVDVDS